MSNLYKIINELCEEHRITGYKLCKDLGIQPSLITDLKMGRKNGMKAETANKIAEYFDVSVGYLLGDEKKPPADEDRELIKDELVAFYGGAKKDLTKADIDDIKSLIRLRAELNRGKE